METEFRFAVRSKSKIRVSIAIGTDKLAAGYPLRQSRRVLEAV